MQASGSIMYPPGVKARVQSNDARVQWSGIHLFIDLWNANSLDNLQVVEQAIVDATSACGATLIEVRAEKYGETGGSPASGCWQSRTSRSIHGRSIGSRPATFSSAVETIHI